MAESEQETYKEYKITEELFQDWLQDNQNDDYIKQKLQMLKDLHDMVFGSKSGDGKV